MAMMRALCVHEFDGGVDSWRIQDVPLATPGPQEVQVRIVASPISFVDQLLARGSYQLRPQLPLIPGTEFSGVISARGSQVDEYWELGRAVTGTVFGGAWAQMTCVRPDALAFLPQGSDLYAASGLAITAATAVYALEHRARVESGETALVLGAGGGLGHAAIQVAKALGLRVIACASSQVKRNAALGAGADAVLDADPVDWRERLRDLAPDGVDVVFDPVGGPLTELAFRSLCWGGRHLMLGFAQGQIPSLRGNLPLLKGASWIGVDVRQFREHEPKAAKNNLERTVELFANGVLQPRIESVHSAADWPAAIEATSHRETSGRVVLNWSESGL